MKTTIKLILVLLLAVGFAFAQDTEAIFNRGSANLKAKKYEACVSDFKAYIAYEPKSPGAHYNLGMCYLELQNHTDAIKAFREATRLKPDYYNAYVFLGNELDTSGSYSAAVIEYNKAVKLEPDNYWAHLELGVAHNNAKKYVQSLASYKTALRLDPDNASAIYGIGLVHYNLNNKLEVKKQIDVLRNLDEDKANQLQAKYDSLSSAAVTKKTPVVKKAPIIKKTAQRIKDEKDVAAMQDLGFDATFVTSVSAIRETASKTGKVLLAVKRNDILSLSDKFDSNGFYQVVDEKTGIDGWIDGNTVVIKLTGNTENSGPALNEDGESENVLANPVVSITNGETKTTLKMKLNGKLYLIPPQTTKVISVSPGKFTYYGWSPGIRPASGKSTLEKGKKYSWNFKIYRR
jgi:tetratricopeptide (TPR) repeat protein